MNTKYFHYTLYTLMAGVILYAGIFATSNKALAQVLLENCNNDLDVEGETYILQNNISGTCTIAANNIIIDGQGLYGIADEINGSANVGDTDGFSFTVQNFISNIRPDIFSNGEGAGNGGTITLNNIHTGQIRARGGFSGGNGGTVIMNNAYGESYIGVYGGDSLVAGGNGGTVIMDNSSVSVIQAWGGNGNDYGAYGENGGHLVLQNNSSVSYIADISAGSFYGPYAGFGSLGSAEITDSFIENVLAYNASYSYDSPVTITRSAPIITLNGDNPLELGLGDIYNEAGATAVDVIDGDISSEIIITGQVGAEIGEYILTYDVSALTHISVTVNTQFGSFNEEAFAGEAEVTRTVIRVGSPESTPRRRSSGGQVSQQFLQEAGITLEGQSTHNRNTQILALISNLERGSDGKITQAGFVQFIMGLIEILNR